MRRLSWVTAGIAALGLPAALCMGAPTSAAQGTDGASPAALTLVAQMPPGGPGGQGGPGAMSQEDMQKMRQQMTDRMLAQSGMTDQEQAAAKQTIKTKEQAKTTLDTELAKLRRVATNSAATQSEMTSALTAFRTALGEYRTKVETADAALLKQLSLPAQVWCTAVGVLDNGGTMLGGDRGQGGQGGPASGPPSRS